MSSIKSRFNHRMDQLIHLPVAWSKRQLSTCFVLEFFFFFSEMVGFNGCNISPSQLFNNVHAHTGEGEVSSFSNRDWECASQGIRLPIPIVSAPKQNRSNFECR